MNTLKKFLRDAMIRPRLTDWATKILPPSVTVFMLHRLAAPELGVEGISSTHLRACLEYLRENNYRFISIEDAIRRAIDGELGREKWVAFTLDDGFEEQVRIGAAVFREFDCPATCFLVTDFVDGKLWPWDYKLKYLAEISPAKTVEVSIDGIDHKINLGTAAAEAFLLRFGRQIAPDSLQAVVQRIAQQTGIDIPQTPPPQLQPTTWSAARAAEQQGMQFAPHSASHFILSRTSDATLRDEIERSARRIQEECNRPASVFCYPSGKADEFDSRAIGAVRKLGLVGAVSAEPGYIEQNLARQNQGYRYALPRLPLPDNLDTFKLYVSWAQRIRENFIESPLQKFYSA